MLVAADTILDDAFRQWAGGRDLVEARINVYEKVRDIRYGVLPELIDAERYVDILKTGMGSCSPKHFLLCEMFQRLGLQVLFVVSPFRWGGGRAELLGGYPQQVKRLAEALPMSHHIACKVEIDGRLVLVDATLDPPLARAGLPANLSWDGFSDTILPVTACGEEQIYHASEAHLMRPHSGEAWLAFYAELNACLEAVRAASATTQ